LLEQRGALSFGAQSTLRNKASAAGCAASFAGSALRTRGFAQLVAVRATVSFFLFPF